MNELKVGDINPETKAPYTEEEVKALNNFNKVVKASFDELSANMISKEEHDKVVTDLQKQLTEQNEGLKTQVEKLTKGLVSQAKQLQEMGNGNSKGQTQKTIGEQLEDALVLNKEEIAKVSESKNHQLSFTVKAAGTMTNANLTGTAVYNTLSTIEPGITPFVRRQPYLRQIMSLRPIQSLYATWVEQTAADGGAGNTAEGAAKTQADFDLIEQSKKVEKITSYIKVTKENLADIPYMAATINQELMTLLELKLDGDLYNGSGTTPVIKGIVTYATAFSVAATVLADSIAVATRYDAIRAAAWQVKAANHVPNFVLINPIDSAAMDFIKDTTGQYVLPPFISADGSRIAGLTVIENNGVTAGDFLVGDFSKSVLGMREEINIEIGRDADDFTKNLYTVLGELRAVHYVKSQHTTAFVKGTFSTAIAALQI